MRRLITFTYILGSLGFSAYADAETPVEKNSRFSALGASSVIAVGSEVAKKRFSLQEKMLESKNATILRATQNPQVVRDAVTRNEEHLLLGEDISDQINDPKLQKQLADKKSKVSIVWTESRDGLLEETFKQKTQLQLNLGDKNSKISKIDAELSASVERYRQYGSNTDFLKMYELGDTRVALEAEAEALQKSIVEADKKILMLKSSDAPIVRYATMKVNPGHTSEVLERMRELQKSSDKVSIYQTYSEVEHAASRGKLKAVGILGKGAIGGSLLASGFLLKDAYEAFFSKTDRKSSTAEITAATR